jgi:hypothetical protein
VNFTECEAHDGFAIYSYTNAKLNASRLIVTAGNDATGIDISGQNGCVNDSLFYDVGILMGICVFRDVDWGQSIDHTTAEPAVTPVCVAQALTTLFLPSPIVRPSSNLVLNAPMLLSSLMGITNAWSASGVFLKATDHEISEELRGTVIKSSITVVSSDGLIRSIGFESGVYTFSKIAGASGEYNASADQKVSLGLLTSPNVAESSLRLDSPSEYVSQSVALSICFTESGAFNMSVSWWLSQRHLLSNLFAIVFLSVVSRRRKQIRRCEITPVLAELFGSLLSRPKFSAVVPLNARPDIVGCGPTSEAGSRSQKSGR